MVKKDDSVIKKEQQHFINMQIQDGRQAYLHIMEIVISPVLLVISLLFWCLSIGFWGRGIHIFTLYFS